MDRASLLPWPERPPERSLPIFGRAPELRRLLELLRRARNGRPGAVWLAGTGGMGKSRLLAELAEIATREGFVVRFSGGSRELEVPGLWFEATGIRPMGSPPFALGPSLPTGFGRSILGEGERPQVREGSSTRGSRSQIGGERAQSAARACAEILEAAAEHPQLLLLDDFQWADPTSVQTLAFLLRNLRRNRVAAVVAAEPQYGSETEGVPPSSAWLAGSVGRGLLRRLDLAGLPPRTAAPIARGALRGAPLPQPLARELEELFYRVGGSPGYFLEALSLLEADGLLRATRQRPGVGSPAGGSGEAGTIGRFLPPRLRATLQQQLLALDPVELRFLATAALLGPEFELAPVASALGISLPGAMEQSQRIRVRTALLRPGRRSALWCLNPPALETLLVPFLPAPDRRRIAGELARWWEARAPTESRRIAAFFRLAGESPRGAAWSRRALREAMSRREFELVPELVRELVDSLDPPGSIPPQLVAELLQLYSELRSEMADGPSIELVRWLRTRAVAPELEPVLEVFVADAELLLDTSLSMTRLDSLEAELARTHGVLSPPVQAVADILRAYVLCAQGKPLPAAKLARRGARVLARTEDGFHACFGYQLEGWALGCLDRLEPSLRAVQRGRRLAAQHGLLGKSIGLALLETETLALAEMGQFHLAVKRLRAGLLQVEPGAGPRAQGQARATLALLLVELQQPRRAFEEAAAALDLGRGARFPPLVAQAQFAKALALCRQRRWQEGVREMARARELIGRSGGSWLLPVTELLLCRATAELGDPAAALDRMATLPPPPSGKPSNASHRIWLATHRLTSARLKELTGDARGAEREYRNAYRFARSTHELGHALESLEALARLTATNRPALAASFAARLRSVCARNEVEWSTFVGPPDSGDAPEPAEPPPAGGVAARLLRQLLSSGRSSAGGGPGGPRAVVSERALATALGVPRERFAQTLRRLENRGLVRRESRRLPGSRRAVYVFELTAEGRARAHES
ncbi:MAG: AAA family ATPase [Thermoplasmata archaeon]|nr:AAA family ATPase [Thermoplasmata archaeon]